MFNRKYIFEGSIFHCYLSLPEVCTITQTSHIFLSTHWKKYHGTGAFPSHLFPLQKIIQQNGGVFVEYVNLREVVCFPIPVFQS